MKEDVFNGLVMNISAAQIDECIRVRHRVSKAQSERSVAGNVSDDAWPVTLKTSYIHRTSTHAGFTYH